MFNVTESFLGRLLFIIPFYHAVKLAFLLWAYMPQTRVRRREGGRGRKGVYFFLFYLQHSEELFGVRACVFYSSMFDLRSFIRIKLADI